MHPYRPVPSPPAPPSFWRRVALRLPVSLRARRRAEGGHWELWCMLWIAGAPECWYRHGDPGPCHYVVAREDYPTQEPRP